MAIIYVSNAASNGYAVGNDANSGLTKALAKLTFDGAKAVAVAGDTIMFNDGVFTRAGAFSLSTATDIDCNSYRGTTLRCTVAGSRGFLLNHPDGTTVNIGALVFDDMGLSANAFEINAGAALKVTKFKGTEFTGGTQYGFRTDGNTGVVMEDPKFSSTTATIAGGGFNTMGAAGFVDLVRPHVATTNANNGLFFQGLPATPAHVRVKAAFGAVQKVGVPVTIINVSTVNFVYDGQADGMTQRILEVLPGTGPISSLLTVRAIAGAVMQAPVIRRLRGRLHPLHGYGVRIGTDGSDGANDFQIPGAIVTECDLRSAGGFSRGIMFGHMNGGAASHNKLRGFGVSIAGRGQNTGAHVYSNDTEDCTAGYNGHFESQGSGAIAGMAFAFNNMRTRAGYETQSLYVAADPATASPSQRCTWVANNFFAPAGVTIPVVFQVQNDGSVCEFRAFNNYFVASVGAQAFKYNANSFASVTDWRVAFEPTVTEWVPTAHDIRFWQFSYLPLRMMAFRNQPVLHNVLPSLGY